ncbi:bacteriohopanetetrol glucosamine biosynthesis glycosyltransferase HpnI [Methylocystis sp. IM3]|uniref:bacteriohopanetetrol glucosamine biosynthesis glycosyltransferase HpnI n=1 Tax=Methylocystis sp. IM3 TaxID=3136722 RepID=UPI003119CBBB
MVCASGACIGCVYLVISLLAVIAFPTKPRPYPALGEPVSILKPLHGDEPGLAERLLSYFEQNYHGAVQMICGVREDTDAALDHVRRLRKKKGTSVETVVNAMEHGPNRKISNLVNIVDQARHEILIVSDSDIEVDIDYLSRVTSHLHESKIGCVSCLYHGVASGGVWSDFEALAINSHFLPDMIFAVTFDLAKPCCGSTIAIRRGTLQTIGGFERYGKHLADDYEVGRSIRLAGYEVVIPGFTVKHHCFANSFRSVLSKELRAARTVRCIDPVGYAGAFITHPFPLALVGMIAYGPNALALAACALGLRALLCIAVQRSFSLPRQRYGLLPFSEVFSCIAYWASFGATWIHWRGIAFKVTAEGELKPVARQKGKKEDLNRGCF